MLQLQAPIREAGRVGWLHVRFIHVERHRPARTKLSPYKRAGKALAFFLRGPLGRHYLTRLHIAGIYRKHMSILTRQFKDRLKRHEWIVSLYLKLHHQRHRLKDWWGTKVWKRTTVVTTPLGFKLISGLHPAYKEMREGRFEIAETRIIKRVLDHVTAFVDVGANLGYYTCLAAQNGLKVVAFEPQQQNLKCLMQNLVVNGYQDSVEVFPLALSDKPGLLTLYGASGPSASLIKGWAGYSPRYRQQIPVSTLDTVLGGRIEHERIFIKIDVEGAEYQVLKGAQRILCRTVKPVWLLEVSLDEFHPAGTNPDFRRIFYDFFEQGYCAFTATENPVRVDEDKVSAWVENNTNNSDTFNYIFMSEDMVKYIIE